MGYVQLGRLLDGAILALFVMCFSGCVTIYLEVQNNFISLFIRASLFMFSELFTLCQNRQLEQYKIGFFLKRIFQIKGNRFEYTLTHILLLAVIMCLLSLRPEVEYYPEVFEKKVLSLKNRGTRKGRDEESESCKKSR